MAQKGIYLLAFYVAKPRDPRQTYKAGYMKDPANIQYDERIEITKGLKDKHRMSAKVVLDLTNKKIVSNGFNHNTGFDEMFKYFYEGYSQYISAIMNQLDPEFMLAYAQAEIEAAKAEMTEEQLAQLNAQLNPQLNTESPTISG